MPCVGDGGGIEAATLQDRAGPKGRAGPGPSETGPGKRRIHSTEHLDRRGSRGRPGRARVPRDAPGGCRGERSK